MCQKYVAPLFDDVLGNEPGTGPESSFSLSSLWAAKTDASASLSSGARILATVPASRLGGLYSWGLCISLPDGMVLRRELDGGIL